jgi:hypothetical protein
VNLASFGQFTFAMRGKKRDLLREEGKRERRESEKES